MLWLLFYPVVMLGVGWALHTWGNMELHWVMILAFISPFLLGLMMVVLVGGGLFVFSLIYRSACPHCGRKALPMGNRMIDECEEEWLPFRPDFTQAECKVCGWQVRRYSGGLALEVPPGDDLYIRRRR